MPQQLQSFSLDDGWVTARAAWDLTDGEMQNATGIFYSPSSQGHVTALWGRTTFGDTGAAAKVKGLAICQFDNAADRIIALAGTSLYKATLGTTGTWASVATGLSSSTTNLSKAQYNDRWYLATGYDRQRVLESDGTLRYMSMQPPQEAPAATVTAAVAAITRPTANTGSGFTNNTLAYDADSTTFASGTLSAAGTASLVLKTWGADASASRTLYTALRLAGKQNQDDSIWTGLGGIGTRPSSGYNVTVTFEKSEDGGGTWSTFYNATLTSYMPATLNIQTPVTANSNLIQTRYTLTYNSGTSPATLQVYDCYINTGGAQTNFSTTTGMYYAVSEYDQIRDLESAPGPISALVTLSTQNVVTLALPSAARNTTSTHWRIYRTTDGGTWPQNGGLLETIAISATTYVDTFKTTKDTQTYPLVPMQQVTVNGTTLYFPLFTPAPLVKHLNVFKGSIVGVIGRALYYSEAGLPEAWPEINVITSFPFPENDNLLATATVGESLIVFARGVVFRMDDLPRVVDGVFNAADVIPLRGVQGAVSQDAIAPFSIYGEPRVAWCTPFGLYETNGVQVNKISIDIQWSTLGSVANAVLRWDPKNMVLVLSYDSNSDGVNDRFALIHMAQECRKQNGQPKWTGPHYGNISSLDGALVNGDWSAYEGHSSNGIVYLQGGRTDASQAYSGTVVPVDFTTGRKYIDGSFYEIDTGIFRSTDGGTDTGTLTIQAGDDMSMYTDTVANTVSLSGFAGTPFHVGRACQWATVQFQYTGSVNVSFNDVALFVRQAGKAGKVLTR